MATDWLCVDGPIAGEWRPGGRSGYQVPVRCKASWTDDASLPPDSIVTYQVAILRISGWRINIPVYVVDMSIPDGTLLPGGIVGSLCDAVLVCRWCFSRPIVQIPGFETCEHPDCVMNWSSVRALDAVNWRDQA